MNDLAIMSLLLFSVGVLMSIHHLRKSHSLLAEEARQLNRDLTDARYRLSWLEQHLGTSSLPDDKPAEDQLGKLTMKRFALSVNQGSIESRDWWQIPSEDQEPLSAMIEDHQENSLIGYPVILRYDYGLEIDITKTVALLRELVRLANVGHELESSQRDES